MPQNSHAYAVGRVRSRMGELLTKLSLDRLCAAETPEGVARALTEMGWGEASSQRDVEAAADRQIADACQTLRALSPDPALTDCLLYKFDVLNLKMIAKARSLGLRATTLSANGTIDAEKLRTAVEKGKFDLLPDALRRAMEEIEKKLGAGAVDPMWLDARLDQALFEQIAEQVAHMAEKSAQAYFESRADAANLMIAVRCHALGKQKWFAEGLFVTGGTIAPQTLARIAEAPEKAAELLKHTPYAAAVAQGMAQYEGGKGLALLEKLMDDYSLSLLNAHRSEPFSILPVVGYFVAREREAAAVRLIVTAKAIHMPAEALSDRLRALYGE